MEYSIEFWLDYEKEKKEHHPNDYYSDHLRVGEIESKILQMYIIEEWVLLMIEKQTVLNICTVFGKNEKIQKKQN